MTTKEKALIVGGLIVAAVGIAVWEKSRSRELAAENDRLRQEATEVAKVRQEANRGDSNELDRAELERLRAWQAQTQRELMRLRGMVGSARGASKAADNLRAQLARQSSEGGTNGVR